MASTLKIDTITTPDGTGNITFSRPVTGNGGLGRILQVVSTTKTDTFTTTSSSYTDITGMSLSITPSATSSKVLILMRGQASSATDGASAWVRFYRDSTELGSGDAGGSSEQCIAAIQTSSASDGVRRAYPTDIVWLDSPNTTSAVSYSLKMKSHDSYTAVFNRSGTQGSYYGNVSSSIVLMEVDA